MDADESYVFETPPSPLTQEESQLELLSASRHVLRGFERHEHRIDILVASLLTVLAGRGALTAETLIQSVRTLWGTESITDEVLHDAIATARDAGLVVVEPGLDAVDRFQITAAASEDVRADREWVRSALLEIASAIDELLAEYGDSRLAGKAAKVTNHVIEAVACGLKDHGIQPPAAVPRVVPAYLDERGVLAYADSIDPLSQRAPVRDLAMRALDPEDPFGNDVVHLVVVGNLLQGLAVQSMPEGAIVGIRLLLDTSVLIHLAEPGSPGAAVVTRLVELSISQGARVLVARHTVEEWNHQWDRAREEAKAITGNTIPVLADRLASNPFLAMYLRATDDPQRLPFTRWASGLSNLSDLVVPLGVEIVNHENTRQIDIERVDALNAALRETGRRSEHAARADANSAAMIARWREEDGVDSAFFVAAEYFTGAAFRESIDSDNPLVASPYSWLAFIARASSGDSESDAELVEIIANAMVRDTVFGLASGYTFEEILVISEILSVGGEMTYRDVRELRGPDLFELPEVAETGISRELMSSRFLQRKAQRAVFRAGRDRDAATAKAADVVAEADALLRDARAREASANERARELEQELATSREAEQAAEAMSRRQKDLRRLGRRRVAGTLLGSVVAAAIVVSFLLGWIGALVAGIAAIVLLWAITACWVLFVDPSASAKRVLPFLIGEMAILALGVLLPLLSAS